MNPGIDTESRSDSRTTSDLMAIHFERLTESAVLVELLAGIGVSVLSGLSIAVVGLSSGVILAIAGLLAVGMGAQLARRFGRYENRWFQARAIAETVKSIQWEYSMRAGNLGENTVADGNLRLQVEEARNRYAKSLGLSGQASINDEVTPEMRSIRALSWQERRLVYIPRRVNDQVVWYSGRALENRRLSSLYGIIVAVLQITGIAIAAYGFLTASLQAVVILTVLATVIVSLIGWTQSRRHAELVEPYFYSSHSLEEIGKRISEATTERSFLDLVAESEYLISREHQMWQWSRGIVGRPLAHVAK